MTETFLRTAYRPLPCQSQAVSCKEAYEASSSRPWSSDPCASEGLVQDMVDVEVNFQRNLN